ncbi:MAG: hypothetical protein WD010_05625 [Nitriliruptor sp.]
MVVSFRQRVTPGRLLGRVDAGFRLRVGGTMPLGADLDAADVVEPPAPLS